MFNPKLVALIITAILILTVCNTYSQQTNVTRNKTVNLKDMNQEQMLCKLYDIQQIRLENVAIIKFELGEKASVLLTVIDSKGMTIATLIDDTMDAGIYNVNYKSGDNITSGEYTYKLDVKGASGIKNMFAVK